MNKGTASHKKVVHPACGETAYQKPRKVQATWLPVLIASGGGCRLTGPVPTCNKLHSSPPQAWGCTACAASLRALRVNIMLELCAPDHLALQRSVVIGKFGGKGQVVRRSLRRIIGIMCKCRSSSKVAASGRALFSCSYPTHGCHLKRLQPASGLPFPFLAANLHPCLIYLSPWPPLGELALCPTTASSTGREDWLRCSPCPGQALRVLRNLDRPARLHRWA